MGAPKRILIVNGDPHMHQMLREALGTPDREFESAFDDNDGMRRMEGAPFDLVLAGKVDTLAAIRREAPVIVLALASTTENALRALREGAYAYFSIPFTVSALATMVEHAMETVPAEGDIEIQSAAPDWVALRLRCKRETADRVLQFVRELSADLSAPERENVATAFREILSNAIEHGGGLDPTKKTAITCIRTGRALLCSIRDPGEGFSFRTLPHAAVSNPVECPFAHSEVRQQLGMRPGGFGILLARQFVDELIYNEKGNEALLIKYLPPHCLQGCP